MLPVRLVFSLLSILVLLASVGTPTEASALKLCMRRADFPFGPDDARREGIERLLTRDLTAAAITVAPSVAVETVLEKVAARSGDIFDPDSGRVDQGRQAAQLDDLERSVRAELGCIGFVQLGLHQVFAWYDGEYAAWDGYRTSIITQGIVARRVALGALTGITGHKQGWIPALSLSIQVTTLRQAEVAYRIAGVEPLVRFSASHGEDHLPPELWLRDEALVEAAIGSALGAELVDLKTNGHPGDAPLPEGFRWE